MKRIVTCISALFLLKGALSRTMALGLAAVSVVVMATLCLSAEGQAGATSKPVALPALLPKPAKMEAKEGTFTLNAKTAVAASAALKETAGVLASDLRQATGLPVSPQCQPLLKSRKGSKACVFEKKALHSSARVC
ncbi:MAG: glycoside hydrolase family 20 zincin-like fold domain-containing protein [bacterium]